MGVGRMFEVKQNNSVSLWTPNTPVDAGGRMFLRHYVVTMKWTDELIPE